MTALVTAVAGAAGRGASGTAAVALAVLAGQLSVGWANDALDARRDAAVGRVDKPAAGGALAPRVVAVAAATALVLCVPLSLLSGTRAAAAHLTGVVGGGWAYNLGLKATWWSLLTYAIGFRVASRVRRARPARAPVAGVVGRARRRVARGRRAPGQRAARPRRRPGHRHRRPPAPDRRDVVTPLRRGRAGRGPRRHRVRAAGIPGAEPGHARTRGHGGGRRRRGGRRCVAPFVPPTIEQRKRHTVFSGE
ncbi:UbiA family prenyltransferase [Yinghuangia aomiensis]